MTEHRDQYPAGDDDDDDDFLDDEGRRSTLSRRCCPSRCSRDALSSMLSRF